MMKKLAVWMLAAAVAFTTAACAGPNVAGVGEPVEGQAYRSITAEEAQELIGKEHVHLVDVRNPDELTGGYIDGMVNIRLNDLSDEISAEVPDKGDVVILYCASGNRSAKAARMLCNAGYRKVYDLGGISDWPYAVKTD